MWSAAGRVAFAAALLCAFPAVLAGEPVPPPFTGRLLDDRTALRGDLRGDLRVEVAREGGLDWRQDHEVNTRFYRGRLLPRVERQFGRLGQYRWVAQPNQPWSESVLHEEVTEAARKGLERATQRAVEDYLLEETALRFVALSLDRRSRRAPGEGRDRPSAVRLGLGLSHGLPELELRTRVGGARLRLELAAHGELGIGIGSPRSGRADVFAAFDPSASRYSLSTRFSY